MDRELLDEDGENQAVRTFLMLYGTGLTVARMREHMASAGWPQAPEWATKPEAQGHLTKGGAQDWLRHLFALEKPAGQQLLDQAMAELREMSRDELIAEMARHKDSDIAVSLRELNSPTPETQQQPQPR
ncbi:MAG: hypothetical protein ACN6N5_13200 [Diaphorobacter nitroreducens]